MTHKRKWGEWKRDCWERTRSREELVTGARKMATIQELAQYIYQMEGNGPNTLATKNNNPGNLRTSPYAIGSNGGYATFDSMEEGWNALYYQITLDQSRGLSLRDFIYKYAPPSENNTVNYLSFIATKLGLSVDTPLGDLGNDTPNPGTGNITIANTQGNDSGSGSGNSQYSDTGDYGYDLGIDNGVTDYDGESGVALTVGSQTIPMNEVIISAVVVGLAALIAAGLKGH